MAKKLSKNMVKARALVEHRPYTLIDAVPLLKKAKYAKFDETVDLNIRLGVDPKHADQMVRGTVVLPHGLGKTKIVAVIASGDKIADAVAAGADFVGGDELVEKIQKEGWTGLRRADRHARHDEVGRPAGQGARPQGPDAQPQDRHRNHRRGRPPSRRSRPARWSSAPTRPRWCTFRSASSRSSRRSWSDNAMTVISSVLKAKPSAAKGKYIKGITSARPWAPAFSSTRPSPRPR